MAGAEHILHFDEDTDVVTVKYRDTSGVQKIREFSIETFVRGMSASSEYTTPLLARGTKMYCQQAEGYTIAYEVLPHRRTIKARIGRGTEEYTIPIPGVMFFFKFKKLGQGLSLVNAHVYALKFPVTTPESDLYKFPFGNVWTNSGKICWGGALGPIVENNNQTIMTIAEVPILVEAFFGAPFNEHLGTNNFSPIESTADIDGNTQTISIKTSSSLIAHLAGKDAFPFDILQAHNKFEKSFNKFVTNAQNT